MKLVINLFLGLFFICKISIAQNPNSPQAGQGRMQAASPATSIATVTQGMKKYEGYFNFYYDEKSARILLEIDKFDKEFLYVNTLPAGGGGAGDRGNIGGFRIVKFFKIGNKIMLTLPNYDYRAISTNPYESKIVEESFPQSVIWGFTPVALEGDKALVDSNGIPYA